MKEILLFTIILLILWYISSRKEYFRQELKQDQPPFNELIGRYIILTHPTKLDTSNPLNIAEIEVYDENLSVGRLKGGANNKMSSTLEGYPVSNLEDGNVSTFAHTNDARPWMLVDLGADKKLQKIVVQNRRDCCKERLQGANIIVVNDANGTDIVNRLNNERDITSGYAYRSGFDEAKDTYEFNVRDWKKPYNKSDCQLPPWRDVQCSEQEYYFGRCSSYTIDNGGWGSCVIDPDKNTNPWGIWGTKTRTRSPSVPAKGGGSCPSDLIQTQSCRSTDRDPCDCNWDDFGYYGGYW